MSILKYKDPKTGEFKRINPYKADLSFVGKDGIVVNKAPNSEEVEISGSGLVQKLTPGGATLVYAKYSNGRDGSIVVNENYTGAQTLPTRNRNGELIAETSAKAVDKTLTNKKYVADNYVEKVKFTNLEQALYGYILDTNEETYADLDSAVLKNSVAVGDNVYPIADKTRALVTQIEGKSTKMVQLLDKSKFPATTTNNGVTFTNNGDGTITVNGTVTADNHAYIQIQGNIECIASHKYLIIGCPEGGLAGKTYGISGQSVGNPIVWDVGKGNIFSFTSLTVITFYLDFYTNDATYTNKIVTPQLFDLTAMNREDITTVEQFKAEFPELYPYENGNIYPAKISGVKFTGKNLLKLKLSSTNKCNTNIEGDVLKITPTTSTAEDIVFAEVKTHLKAGEYVFSSIDKNTNTTSTQFIISKGQYGENNITSIFSETKKFVLDSESDIYILIYPCLHAELPFKAMSVQIQIQAGSQATTYEPYIEPVSVTLPQTYDLHGIGDYKDYLEITKNEDNELYTLKKIQSVEVNESEKTITPLETPVETVIVTNLTYEQVTAVRHNGGLIEVEGNANKGYARPTIKNTIVYRLTATNTAEG